MKELYDRAPTDGAVRPATITSPTGKKRRIHVPNESLQTFHRSMVEWLRSQHAPMTYATACLPNCSPARNAWKHKENRYFYVLDLHNAFRSIQTEWVAEALAWARRELWIPDDVALEFLRKHCMEPRGEGLMTGPAASPDLFNLTLAVRIDEALGQLCAKWGLTYTRYLDDLVFSAQEPIGRHKRAAIRRIIEDAGLGINHRKCRLLDIEKHPVQITGIGIRRSEPFTRFDGSTIVTTSLYPPRKWVRKVSGLLHRFNSGEDISPYYVIGLWSVIAACQATYRSHLEIDSAELEQLMSTSEGFVELQRRLDESTVYLPVKGTQAFGSGMTSSVNRVRLQMITASNYVLPYRLAGETPPPLPEYVRP